MPIQDYQAAAGILQGFLNLLTTHGRLRLRYRITAGAGAADPDGFEAREIYVELAGPDAPLLTARGGELLRALEHIAAKLLGLEDAEHDKVSFDSGNFKAMRARELRLRAQTAAEQALRTGRPVPFPPSNSRERRLLHLILKGHPGVKTHSVGEGRERVLVVFPESYDEASFTPPPVAMVERPRRDSGERRRY